MQVLMKNQYLRYLEIQGTEVGHEAMETLCMALKCWQCCLQCLRWDSRLGLREHPDTQVVFSEVGATWSVCRPSLIQITQLFFVFFWGVPHNGVKYIDVVTWPPQSSSWTRPPAPRMVTIFVCSCISLSISAFSDFTAVTWNQPWWRCLHSRHGQIRYIRAFFSRVSKSTFQGKQSLPPQKYAFWDIAFKLVIREQKTQKNLWLPHPQLPNRNLDSWPAWGSWPSSVISMFNTN